MHLWYVVSWRLLVLLSSRHSMLTCPPKLQTRLVTAARRLKEDERAANHAVYEELYFSVIVTHHLCEAGRHEEDAARAAWFGFLRWAAEKESVSLLKQALLYDDLAFLHDETATRPPSEAALVQRWVVLFGRPEAINKAVALTKVRLAQLCAHPLLAGEAVALTTSFMPRCAMHTRRSCKPLATRRRGWSARSWRRSAVVRRNSASARPPPRPSGAQMS